MLGLGISLGLGAALCQALSYLATRHFVQGHGGGIRKLMVLGHVIMGLIAAAVLPFVWPGWEATGWGFLRPLVWCSLWCVLGQIGLAVLLRYAEPSRVSPMLAFKLVILAALTILVAHQPIGLLQWVAIVLCIAGALALNFAGTSDARFRPRGDAAGLHLHRVFVVGLEHRLAGGGIGPHGALAGIYVCNACKLYPLRDRRDSPAALVRIKAQRDWMAAAPFAVSWLLAMLLLFACFGLVGVVYGNILQSTRGLISLGLGAVSVRLGLLHLERATTRTVFLRRLIATLMMTAAVVLYAVGKDRAQQAPREQVQPQANAG